MTSNLYGYLTALAVPIALILVSGVTRKVVRATPFCRADFYMGIDLTIAALSLALVNIVDLIGGAGKNAPTETAAISTVWYIIACIFLFLLQIAFHQEWAGERTGRKKQILMLGFACNVLGVLLLGAFMVLKIRGKL